MRKPTSIADANRIALGLILVGFGALALDDSWFPQGLIVIGVGLMARHTSLGFPWQTAQLAISLLILAGMFWIREQLLRMGLGEWVPIGFVLVGGGLLGWMIPSAEASPPTSS